MKSHPIIDSALVLLESCITCRPVPHPTSIITSSGEESIFDISQSISMESARAEISSPYLQGSWPSIIDERDSNISNISSSEIFPPPQNLNIESST